VTRILGHDTAIDEFLTAMQSDRMHHAWMLVGRQGIGKATLARKFAARMLAEAAAPGLGSGSIELPPENKTAMLIAAQTHPDFKLLDRLPKDDKLKDKDRRELPEGYERARSITVDQVRSLNASFTTTPSMSARRVVVIDAIDDMERSSANALLKNLEEPPAGTIFLLVNHVPGRVLPTIRSRCRILRFSSMTDDVMTTIMRHHLPDADPEELAAIVRAGEGAPGRALALEGQGLAELDLTLLKLSTHGDPSNCERLALASKLSGKAAQARYELFLARVPAFLADAAKQRQGDALGLALRHWDDARRLAQSAVSSSLEPQSVVFALASHVAALAPRQGSAKA
jgi:DNA polymerase III subunit delta'